jgi:hypothetical protein
MVEKNKKREGRREKKNVGLWVLCLIK